MEDKFPFVTTTKLPHSEQRVKLVRHHFLHMVQSLLTDPRLQDDDFDFPDNDPFAPPEESPIWLESMRSGEAYRKSYEKHITKPRQILLPIPFHIDGAQTAQ